MGGTCSATPISLLTRSKTLPICDHSQTPLRNALVSRRGFTRADIPRVASLTQSRAAGRERRSTKATYSLMVRTTLEVGRPSTVGSLASLRTCSSYDAMVVNVPFGFMNTIR